MAKTGTTNTAPFHYPVHVTRRGKNGVAKPLEPFDFLKTKDVTQERTKPRVESRRDPIPYPERDQRTGRNVGRTYKVAADERQLNEAVTGYIKQVKRLSRHIDKACDSEENGRFDFHPNLNREEAAICYAILMEYQLHEIADTQDAFYFDEDECVVRREYDDMIVAGFKGEVVFDIEPEFNKVSNTAYEYGLPRWAIMKARQESKKKEESFIEVFDLTESV